eukprot:gnl/MRDRNA2_/MRDRNA2_134397_c0_seq1.p1 gnl/MRDRNA2_/MRDRNA2_134397_c0~~gnl/MRDRNA2_/MRDRNA2_134397_c0_seq1.p1  ORF type:complete len:375 (-),score=88.06 gnl/MRDRNA2_/MRDRNA2_134397_c0_seq1:63-1187(-)
MHVNVFSVLSVISTQTLRLNAVTVDKDLLGDVKHSLIYRAIKTWSFHPIYLDRTTLGKASQPQFQEKHTKETVHKTDPDLRVKNKTVSSHPRVLQLQTAIAGLGQKLTLSRNKLKAQNASDTSQIQELRTSVTKLLNDSKRLKAGFRTASAEISQLEMHIRNHHHDTSASSQPEQAMGKTKSAQIIDIKNQIMHQDEVLDICKAFGFLLLIGLVGTSVWKRRWTTSNLAKAYEPLLGTKNKESAKNGNEPKEKMNAVASRDCEVARIGREHNGALVKLLEEQLNDAEGILEEIDEMHGHHKAALNEVFGKVEQIQSSRRQYPLEVATRFNGEESTDAESEQRQQQSVCLSARSSNLSSSASSADNLCFSARVLA